MLLNRYGQQFSKLSVTENLRIKVNQIAADQNRHVYDVAEEAFRQLYPNYFKN
jgi:hypothetical protein